MFQYKILHNIVFTKSLTLKQPSLLFMLKYKTGFGACAVLMSSGLWILESFSRLVRDSLELSNVKILYGIFGNENVNKLTNFTCYTEVFIKWLVIIFMHF